MLHPLSEGGGGPLLFPFSWFLGLGWGGPGEQQGALLVRRVSLATRPGVPSGLACKRGGASRQSGISTESEVLPESFAFLKKKKKTKVKVNISK